MTHTSVPCKEIVWNRIVTLCGFLVLQLALAMAITLFFGENRFANGQDVPTASSVTVPGLSADPADSASSADSSPGENQSSGTSVASTNEKARQERLAHLQRFNDKTIPWLNVIFVWIGFIFSAGLLAKGIVAFTDEKAGLWTVMFAGTVGTIANIGIQLYLFPDKEIKPISVSGFILTFLIAFFFMLIYVKCVRIGRSEK